jgi:two-component system phosphate regulon sensor histidine kinase PhoR
VDITLTRENSRAILSIRDSGCGIPAESLPHVYERFYRVVNSPAHRGKGAGLGLSIVKKIALLHHFEVELDSKPDVGTTTRVLFPLMAPLA